MWNPADNWLATSSFVEPVAIPSAHPGDEPRVCLSVNKAWLPYVIGSLLQLAQPAAWAATDPTALATVLTDATELIESFGTAGSCDVLEFRFTEDCILQYSTDGGSTWLDTPGWDTFSGACFTGATGATGPEGPPGPVPPPIPPNIPGSSTTDEACNIGSYLAALIIKAAIQQQVDAINASATILAAALGLVALIPGLGLVIDIGLAAAFALNAAIAAHGTSAFTTALADATLWADAQCAIYLNIKTVGYVDATNYDDVHTALAAISYTDGDVVSAIADYWTALTLTGVQAAQSAGSLYVGDCSSCEFTPGCITPTAAVIGTGMSYDATPIGGGTATVIGADGLYCGITFDPPNYLHNYTLQATYGSGFAGVGFYQAPLAHGGPNAGDNLWVNSVSVVFILYGSSNWEVLSNGTVVGSGSASYGAGHMSLSFYPGAHEWQAELNGTLLWNSVAFPVVDYIPVVELLHPGSQLTNLLLCQST